MTVLESERENTRSVQQKSYWSKYCLKRYVLRLALKAETEGRAVTESERQRSRTRHGHRTV